MRFKIVVSLILLALVVGAASQFAATAHHPVLTKDADSNFRRVEVSFFVQAWHRHPPPSRSNLREIK